MSKINRLSVVHNAANEMEAQVIKSLLESYGIPCLLQPNMALPRPYSPVYNLGGIAVLVPESMRNEAERLIQGEKDV
ncbi:putative signal transducing protein [Chloroflexota bacterium]